MKNKIRKVIQNYLSKIKSQTPQRTRILSTCKQPKTASFTIGRTQNDAVTRQERDISAKLSDIDQFLAENFKSLYAKEESTGSESEPRERVAVPEKCVVVVAYSPEPQAEFRRSMKEVVEGRERLDWGFMEEILMCYLDLNDKLLHRFVLGAFVDLVIELRSSKRLRQNSLSFS